MLLCGKPMFVWFFFFFNIDKKHHSAFITGKEKETLRQCRTILDLTVVVTEFLQTTNNTFGCITCCISLTRGVHPALSFRLGSAPWSNSSLTASTSPCRTHRVQQQTLRSELQTCKTQPFKHSSWSQCTKAPAFINHTPQWAIDYLVGDPEEDYSYVYKDYCKTVYSQQTRTWLKTKMFNGEVGIWYLRYLNRQICAECNLK